MHDLARSIHVVLPLGVGLEIIHRAEGTARLFVRNTRLKARWKAFWRGGWALLRHRIVDRFRPTRVGWRAR